MIHNLIPLLLLFNTTDRSLSTFTLCTAHDTKSKLSRNIIRINPFKASSMVGE